jgi:small subunit ribosomal protein S11
MSLSSFVPLARATLASSSRVGLDFTRPAAQAVRSARFVSTTSSVGAATAPLSSTLSSSTSSPAPVGSDGEPLPTLRWNPHPVEPFLMRRGLPDRAPTHTLTVLSSRNNAMLTFTDKVGPLFPTITAGTGNVFRKSHRSSYEAAHQAALKMITKILDASRSFHAQGNKFQLRIAYKGLQGHGREAVHAALNGPEGEEIRNLIARVEDRTPIKIGGTRARKPRRL